MIIKSNCMLARGPPATNTDQQSKPHETFSMLGIFSTEFFLFIEIKLKIYYNHGRFGHWQTHTEIERALLACLGV